MPMAAILIELLYLTNHMNNSTCEPLIGSQFASKRPIQLYLQLFEQYQLHARQSFNHLRYFLAVHILCTTIRHIVVFFWSQDQPLSLILFNYLGYFLWGYLLVGYHRNYPSMDPHSVYNKQQQFLHVIKVSLFTYQLTLCLLLLGYLAIIHICLTKDGILVVADCVLVALSLRSMYQTELQEQQLSKSLAEMQSSNLYTIAEFRREEMRQPFELEQIQDRPMRVSSLGLCVPDFMHSFYKPKLSTRLEEQDCIDQAQLYSH